MSNDPVHLRRDLEKVSLEEVADRVAFGPTSFKNHAGLGEFARRQAIWQRDTAEATRCSARYMLWSVIGIWVTTGLVAVFTFTWGTRPELNKKKYRCNRSLN